MKHVVTTDETQVCLKDRGSGRPVIPVRGWPSSIDRWDDQPPAPNALPGGPSMGRGKVACGMLRHGRQSSVQVVAVA